MVGNNMFQGAKASGTMALLIGNAADSALEIFRIIHTIGILRGYAIRSGRRPEGSRRPQGGPQVRQTSRGTSA